jgi:glycosyltransferase involved in cell wall biosynthesis
VLQDHLKPLGCVIKQKAKIIVVDSKGFRECTLSSVYCAMKQRVLKPRHWSINGRFLTRSITGVDRYALEILNAINNLIEEGHPLTEDLVLEILCPAVRNLLSPFSHIPVRILPKAPGHIWEQAILPWYVNSGLLSLCNTGPVSVRKQVVCIHDLNSRVVPESYGAMFRVLYRLVIPALGRRAAQLVTVSDFSRKTMAEFRIAPLEDIVVIHDGYEHMLRADPNRSQFMGANLPRPFVLLVGSKAPHKNAGLIYSIAAELGSRGIHILVSGGGNPNVYASRSSTSLPKNVKHLGRVNDDDLAFLYQNALCLVFPSRTEGFGLPALEAMAVGCPVIASDAASLPEVCGDGALYACPDDAPPWLGAIARLVSDATLRQRLAANGRTRAKAFSWREGAQRYLELMFALDVGSDQQRL